MIKEKRLPYQNQIAVYLLLALFIFSEIPANGATAPAVITGSTGTVTANSAILNGTVNPNGAATTYYFEYGTTTNYDASTPIRNSTWTDSAGVKAYIASLIPNTTYHYRLVASNSAGKTNGMDQIFTTLRLSPVSLNLFTSVVPESGRLPLNIVVYFDSVGGVPPFSYTISYGDTTTDTVVVSGTKSHIYEVAGSYQLTVTVKDGKGNIDTVSHTIRVEEVVAPLSAIVKVTPENGIAPLAVQLDTVIAGGIGPYRIFYDFGDGIRFSNTDMQPVDGHVSISHIYAKPGQYNAIITVKDKTGRTVFSTARLRAYQEGVNVKVIASQKQGILGDAGMKVEFTAEIAGGTAPYTYAWHLAKNITSDIANPVHVYRMIGNYLATLIVSDSTGKTGSDSVEIRVSDLRKLTIRPVEVWLSERALPVIPLVRGYYSDGIVRILDAVTYISSDEAVARVENRQIVALGDGTAVITASAGKLSSSMIVHVNLNPVSLDLDASLVTLAPEETHTPAAMLIYANGRKKEMKTFSIEVPSGGESIVAVNGMQLTALSAGDVTLRVTAGNLTAPLIVNVANATVPLNIRPSRAKLLPDKSLNIFINGGKPPYSSSVGTVNGMNWRITAPSDPGEKVYTVKDSSGTAVPFTMTVPEKLSILRSDAVEIRHGNTIALAASGGTPPYKWYATSGNVESATSDADVTYRIPDAVGNHTVTVTDSGGQSADYLLTTYADLIVSPSTLYLSPGEVKIFSVVGGTAPYSAVTTAGTITDDGDGEQFNYEAPDVIGNYEITISDMADNQTTLYVQVSHPLWVSPQMSYLRQGEHKLFQLAGGIGKDEELYIQALRGDVSPNPSDRTFEYVAPEEIGQDIIMVTDIDGTQAKVEIEVTSENFFVTPSTVALLPRETATFLSVRGTGDSFTWIADMGDILADVENSSNITYQAPDERGKGDITCRDIEQRIANAQVHIISDRVLITPQLVYLFPGEQTRFRALLGTEEYEFTYTDGSITSPDGGVPDITSNEIIYRAPERIGEFFVTVFDSAGNEAQAKVVVSGGTVKPQLSATESHLLNLPSETPDSATQPVGVGSVQNGGTTLDLAVNFPNYSGDDEKPVPMNYYLAIFMERSDTWFFFKEGNTIGDITDIGTYMSGMTDTIYQSVLGGGISLCNPDPAIPLYIYHIYAIAVESGYDINKNLAFNPSDAPFEVWEFSFEFKGCPEVPDE